MTYQFIQPPLEAPARSHPIGQSRPSRLQSDQRVFFGSTHIDNGGCSYYRILFISQLLSQIYDHVFCCDARLRFTAAELFPLLSSYRLQRACSLRDLPWFHDVILTAKRRHGFSVIYEIDDVLVRDDIPLYNCYRDIFQEGAEAIPAYMNGSDVITVTCDQLADYYSTKFGIPRSKFHVIPNYLPRYFFDSYDEAVILDRIRGQKMRRPRLCFSCGPSHVDVRRTGAGDDFDGMVDWIVENRKRYQFIFHGGFPPTLESIADDVIRIPAGPFLDYPRVRRSIRADLFIQPLRRSVFNECKSPIKLLESWAEGTPAFVQNLGTYRQLAPEACFDTSDTLDRQIDALFADTDAQFELIRRNYIRMNDFWLDNHLDDWLAVMMPTEKELGIRN